LSVCLFVCCPSVCLFVYLFSFILLFVVCLFVCVSVVRLFVCSFICLLPEMCTCRVLAAWPNGAGGHTSHELLGQSASARHTDGGGGLLHQSFRPH